MLYIDNDKVTKNIPITNRIAEDQEEYLTLPANIDSGIVSYAFKLTWKDVFKLIFKRRIYFYQITFGQSLQPIHANVDENEFEEFHKDTVETFGRK